MSSATKTTLPHAAIERATALTNSEHECVCEAIEKSIVGLEQHLITNVLSPSTIRALREAQTALILARPIVHSVSPFPG